MGFRDQSSIAVVSARIATTDKCVVGMESPSHAALAISEIKFFRFEIKKTQHK